MALPALRIANTPDLHRLCGMMWCGVVQCELLLIRPSAIVFEVVLLHFSVDAGTCLGSAFLLLTGCHLTGTGRSCLAAPCRLG